MNIGLIRKTPIKILLDNYYFDYQDNKIKIPAGYAFDGLSIPRLLQGIVRMNETENIIAGLEHDFLYSVIAPLLITKEGSDGHLLSIMRTRYKYRAVLIYLGVHFFGCFSYKKDYNYKKYKVLINNERKRLGLIK